MRANKHYSRRKFKQIVLVLLAQSKQKYAARSAAFHGKNRSAARSVLGSTLYIQMTLQLHKVNLTYVQFLYVDHQHISIASSKLYLCVCMTFDTGQMHFSILYIFPKHRLRLFENRVLKKVTGA